MQADSALQESEEKMSKALVALADGFELCEALMAVDLLRRAHIDVQTIAVGDSLSVRSSNSVTVIADEFAADVDFDSFDALILPGGIPGANNLAESPVISEQCRCFAEGRLLAAICASPAVVLSPLGLLKGRRATAYPGFDSQMDCLEATGNKVVIDGSIITGQALGAAEEFALAIISRLEGADAAERVKRSIVY